VNAGASAVLAAVGAAVATFGGTSAADGAVVANGSSPAVPAAVGAAVATIGSSGAAEGAAVSTGMSVGSGRTGSTGATLGALVASCMQLMRSSNDNEHSGTYACV
jgi:hypothetical protein